MIANMQAQRLIESITKQYFGYEQTKYLPLKDPDMSVFSVPELMEIDEVIVKYGDKNGKWLTNFSHGDIPWKATKEI